MDVFDYAFALSKQEHSKSLLVPSLLLAEKRSPRAVDSELEYSITTV